MNFAFKTRNFVLKTRNCVLKTRKLAFKMINFAVIKVTGMKEHAQVSFLSKNPDFRLKNPDLLSGILIFY